MWDTASGEELQTLEGHRNVVYAIAFNNPYGYVCFISGVFYFLATVLFVWYVDLLSVVS